MTEDEHQENLISLIKYWKSKSDYYGELADTLVVIFEEHLEKSIKDYGKLI